MLLAPDSGPNSYTLHANKRRRKWVGCNFTAILARVTPSEVRNVESTSGFKGFTRESNVTGLFMAFLTKGNTRVDVVWDIGI